MTVLPWSRVKFTVRTRSKGEVFKAKAFNGGLVGGWLANDHGAASRILFANQSLLMSCDESGR